MNKLSLMPGVLALLLTIPTLAGCANNQAFLTAARQLGITKADADGSGVDKKLPLECHQHTQLLGRTQVVGADPHVVVRTYEKQVVPGANRKLDRCVSYAENLLGGIFATGKAAS